MKPDYCRTCIGHCWGNDFTRVTGENNVPLLFVGEASGATEARRSEPFIGKAGEVLEKALKTAGLKRSDYSITNCLRCRPPLNDLKGAPYEREALDHCRKYLDDVVAERQPKLIVALGDIPFRELSTTTGSISDLRGYILKSRYGIPLISVYHPSFIQRGAWHVFGAAMHDIRVANRCATVGFPDPVPTHYNLSPTLDDCNAYLRRLRDDPALPVAYDIETEELIVKNPITPRRIIQVQFSLAVGEALVVPFSDPYLDFIHEVLLSSNTKFDYNGRLFDRRILRDNGFELNGEFHDVMEMYGHTQSGFLSSKDDNHGDKGVPSRLMSLQSCLSFWYPAFRPWKHAPFPQWEGRWDGQQLPLPVRLYGARDADATIRCALKLRDSLERIGLAASYRRHKWELGAVLDDMGNRGLPVDRDQQVQLREFCESEQQRLLAELQDHIPQELRPIHPKEGYKGKHVRIDGKSVKLPELPPNGDVVMLSGEAFTTVEVELETPEGECYTQRRWCRLLEFNPNSPIQLLNYIKFRLQQFGEPWFLPTHIDTGKETTAKEEVDKLAAATGDSVLVNVRHYRQLSKIKGTYTEGDWIPINDGRVHPQWSFGTSSGQLAPRRPNSAQYPTHGKLAKMAKACIRAEEGHTFIKRDMRSYHARSLAWLSGDKAYWTLSDEDVHSFVAAHFLRLPIATQLLKMDAVGRRAELARIKVEHADVRNLQAKRAILGLGFHMGVDKLFRMNPEAFESPLYAKELIELIQSLFPKAFVEYPRSIEKRIKQSPRLVSPTQHQRWVWSGDLEQAVSFEPANIAHCHMFDSMLIMQERGLLDRWQLCNMIHDCLIFHCPNELVDECIEGSREIMERKSTVLTESPLGIPFQCSSDVEIGVTMAEMREL